MNFPNNAQMRFIMSNRCRLLESGREIGGGGGEKLERLDTARRKYGKGEAFVLPLCGNKVSGFFKRVRGRLREAGVTLPKWHLWVLGILIYCYLAVVLEPVAEELIAVEEQLTLYEWVIENEADLRNEYKNRVEQAHDVCNRYEVYMSQTEYIRGLSINQGKVPYSDWFTLKRVNWNYMYYVPQEDFVYCKVPKSGSTTWVYNLLKLANAPEEKISSDIGLHKILRDYYPKMASSKMKQAFKKSFKLLVVRHPFERILSAYRDKLENYQRDLMFRDGYYYTIYGKSIVQVYRDEADLSLKNRTEPTWTEFVRYVINTPSSKFDEHWKPIYSLCSPCVIKYNVIAKMETFSEDTQYVINQLGLEDQLHVEWIHRTANDRTSDVANIYFSQLTRHQVDQLYETYKLDFELFDYDYEAYRAMARD